MDKLKIEYLKVDDLIPYANNPRNNDDAVAGVVESVGYNTTAVQRTLTPFMGVQFALSQPKKE